MALGIYVNGGDFFLNQLTKVGKFRLAIFSRKFSRVIKLIEVSKRTFFQDLLKDLSFVNSNMFTNFSLLN